MKKRITLEQVNAVIMTDYPEQADYWLHNGGGRHSHIEVNVKCPECGHQETVKIRNRSELKRLLKKNCTGCEAQERLENEHLEIRLAFGKHRGETINTVMLEDPSYLAWIVDQVRGQDSLKEQIKTHTRFPEVWAAYLEKRTKGTPRVIRLEEEWREGRFSRRTIDDVCNRLFRSPFKGQAR